MKVEGPNKTRGTGASSKKGKVSSSDGSFSGMLDGGPKDVSGAGAAQSIAHLDALLAVQGAEDPTERAKRKRMKDRASSILDSLERIRMRLLTGELTVGDVIHIADVVASHREQISDPALTALLDEIDLRAQVEIAKMRISLNKF